MDIKVRHKRYRWGKAKRIALATLGAVFNDGTCYVQRGSQEWLVRIEDLNEFPTALILPQREMLRAIYIQSRTILSIRRSEPSPWMLADSTPQDKCISFPDFCGVNDEWFGLTQHDWFDLSAKLLKSFSKLKLFQVSSRFDIFQQFLISQVWLELKACNSNESIENVSAYVARSMYHARQRHQSKSYDIYDPSLKKRTDELNAPHTQLNTVTGYLGADEQDEYSEDSTNEPNGIERLIDTSFGQRMTLRDLIPMLSTQHQRAARLMLELDEYLQPEALVRTAAEVQSRKNHVRWLAKTLHVSKSQAGRIKLSIVKEFRKLLKLENCDGPSPDLLLLRNWRFERQTARQKMFSEPFEYANPGNKFDLGPLNICDWLAGEHGSLKQCFELSRFKQLDESIRIAERARRIEELELDLISTSQHPYDWSPYFELPCKREWKETEEGLATGTQVGIVACKEKHQWIETHPARSIILASPDKSHAYDRCNAQGLWYLDPS